MSIVYKLHTYKSVVGDTLQFIVCRNNGPLDSWYPLAFVSEAKDAARLVVELNKLHQELESSKLSVSNLQYNKGFDSDMFSGEQGSRCPGCLLSVDSDTWCMLDCNTFVQYDVDT